MKEKSNVVYFLVSLIAMLFILGVIMLGVNVKSLQNELEDRIKTITLITGLRNDLSEYLSKPRNIDKIDVRDYFTALESFESKAILNPETLHELNLFLVNFNYSTPKKDVQNCVNLINREVSTIRIRLHDISASLENRWMLILMMGVMACLFALTTTALTIRSRIQSDKIAEKNRELEKTKKEAELANKAKSDFVNIMSHEIRTPLNAVVGLTHLLSKTNPTSEQLKHIELLQFSSKNLIGLVNDILDFGKIEAGKVDFEEKIFDLNEQLRKLILTLEPHANSKNLNLRLDIHNSLKSKVIGDPTRLNQIVFNLGNNAIKFTKKGSVKFSIEGLSETETDITFKISVKDTGIGIEKDKQKQIFERFTQANTNTSRKYGGSGLGLTISNQLLKLLGSELLLESEVDKGSTFWFEITLPKADESILKIVSKENEHVANNKSIKILAAEDNRINLLILEKLLQDMDVEYDLASNGKEALDLATQNKYDIILMDLQMPVMDGFESSKKIAEIRGEEKPIIIAISAANESDYIEKIKEANMDDYINKPLDVDKFNAKLAQYFKKLKNA